MHLLLLLLCLNLVLFLLLPHVLFIDNIDIFKQFFNILILFISQHCNCCCGTRHICRLSIPNIWFLSLVFRSLVSVIVLTFLTKINEIFGKILVGGGGSVLDALANLVFNFEVVGI